MNKMMFPGLLKTLLWAVIILPLISCKGQRSPIPQTSPQAFGDYWYQGKAEISSFELSQSRYGAVHDGITTMVFVTEDFSKKRHVKLDEPAKHKQDAVKVLKLNTNKEFITGIYSYNMMSSVYMPVDHDEYPHSLKLTAGTQEWCGQSFMQANWKGNRYEVQQMSYFESEGDAKINLSNAILEDEIWTWIRVAPHTLPTGKIDLIPSAFYLRLSHTPCRAYEALTSLGKTEEHFLYSIQYPSLSRSLDIEFELTFPYRIRGWKETNGENEVTTGRKLNTIMLDYWLHHHPTDEALRNQLDLKY